MSTCPHCGNELPVEQGEKEFFGQGIQLPPTIAEIVDSIGYGG